MIQTGVASFDQGSTPRWNLNSGTGDRSFESVDIGFPQPFAAPPNVAVALSGVDGEHNVNLRVWVEAVDVEGHEFNIRIHTWADTLLYLVRVTWIAFD